MRRFFQSVSVGGPQFIAAALLLVYLLQCLWLVRLEMRAGAPMNSEQALRTWLGLQQWKGAAVAGPPDSQRPDAAMAKLTPPKTGRLRARDGYDEDRSPLYYRISAAPLLLLPPNWWTAVLPYWHVLMSLPYLLFGVLLGGSIWYVARRLYGNAGGYIALTLYCFSPGMIVSAAGWKSESEIGAVWGAFGAIWTGIAVAHTLYAPREVVLWNWRRILLLGLSLALTVGNQFSLSVIVLVTLLLMLWVAPVRRRAVLAIWGASCAIALLLLFASYAFRPAVFWQGMTHARWAEFEQPPLGIWFSCLRVLAAMFRGSPALMLTLPVALIIYSLWKRARYFGNSVPLLVATLTLMLALAAPQFPGEGFELTALVFLFVFVAGVFADLLETRHRSFVMAALGGLLIAAAAWNLLELMRSARP